MATQRQKPNRKTGSKAGIEVKPTVCFWCKVAAEYLYHPGRVNYPMKRVGERGEGKWQRRKTACFLY